MKEKVRKLVEMHIELELLHKKLEADLYDILPEDERNKYSLRKSQDLSVMIIGRACGITPTMLARYLEITKSSVTGLVDSLENNGLIFREPDSTDRRKTLLFLTDKGLMYREKVIEWIGHVLDKALVAIPDEDVDELLNTNEKLIRIFKDLFNHSHFLKCDSEREKYGLDLIK